MSIYHGETKVASNLGLPVVSLTKAQYDALSAGEKAGRIFNTTDESDIIGLATPTADGLQSMADKGAMNILTGGPIAAINASLATDIDDYVTMEPDWTCSRLIVTTWGAMVTLFMTVTRGTATGTGNLSNERMFSWTAEGAKYAPYLTLVSISTASTGGVASGYVDADGAVISACDLAMTGWSFGVTYMRNSMYAD